MNISNERKLAARAKELGESANSFSFAELAELTRSESPLVRRLAASALGKLAGIVDAEPAVKTLQPLLADIHPQVRQYSAKNCRAGTVANLPATAGKSATIPALQKRYGISFVICSGRVQARPPSAPTERMICCSRVRPVTP